MHRNMQNAYRGTDWSRRGSPHLFPDHHRTSPCRRKSVIRCAIQCIWRFVFVLCTWFDGQPFMCKARSIRAQKTTVDSEMDESLGSQSTAQTPSSSTPHDDSPFCQECVRLTDTFTKLHMFSTTSCTVKHSLLTHNPTLKMRTSSSQTRKLKNPDPQKK